MNAIRTRLLERICINSALNIVKKNHEQHRRNCTDTFAKFAGENKDTFSKTKTVTRAISGTRISHEEQESKVDSVASVHLVS